MAGALEILGTTALLGFGTTAAVRIARRPDGPRAAKTSGPACLAAIWASQGGLSPDATKDLPIPAILTLGQFPSISLTPAASAKAFRLLRERFANTQETQGEEALLIAFPAATVTARTERERVAHYRRFGAAHVAEALAPGCAWPDPRSDQIPVDPKEEAVWRSLGDLAVVALSARDGEQIPVDVDPSGTVLDDRLEACVAGDVLLPLRSPTTLAPELRVGDDDRSWHLTHDAQVRAYEALLYALSDLDVTAPVSRVVVGLGPRCPWDQKARYGLRMTTLWYEVRRLEQIAAATLEEEEEP